MSQNSGAKTRRHKHLYYRSIMFSLALFRLRWIKPALRSHIPCQSLSFHVNNPPPINYLGALSYQPKEHPSNMTSNHLKIKFYNPHSSFQNGWHFQTTRQFRQKRPRLSNYFHSTATPQASENFCWSMSWWWMKIQSGILVRDLLFTRKTEKESINDSHISEKPKVSTYQPKNTYKQTKYWYILKWISNPATPPTWSKQRMHSAVFFRRKHWRHISRISCRNVTPTTRCLGVRETMVPATYIPMIYMPGCFHVFFCFSKSLVEISTQRYGILYTSCRYY